jgi:hypothetical protein
MQSADKRRFASEIATRIVAIAVQRPRPKIGDPAMKLGLALAFVLFSSGLAAAQDLRCNQEQALEEVRRLTSTHVIISVDVFMPNVTVVVDDRAWQRTDVAAKKAMAQNVDCATGGPNNHMLHSIYFRSAKSNAALADFSGNELTVRSAESR